MLTMDALVEKYMSVAPESTMLVACKEDVCLLGLIAGLKVALLVNGFLDSLKKLLLLTVPHRHKALRQFGARLYLFLTNS